MKANRRGWRSDLLIILILTLLTLALTWPLVGSLATHVPGDGSDDPPLTWNLWWVRYALLEQGTNPFDCKHLFYPLGINLAYYTLTVLNAFLSIPLQAVLGLIPASNLVLLSTFILSGYGAFLLARYLLCTCRLARLDGAPSLESAPTGQNAAWPVQLAALGGGLLYAFASSKLFYAALGQWNIASSHWIPFYVLYLFKTTKHPRRLHYPFLAALFLLFQAYAELTYATFLVLFTCLWLVWRGLAYLAGPRHAMPWQDASRLVLRLGLLLALLALGMLPMLAAMVPDMLAEGDFLVEGTGFAEAFSADLVGFGVPTMHHPLFGGLVKRFSFDHTVGQHLYFGYTVLALALLGAAAWWRRTNRKSAAQKLKETPHASDHSPAAWVRFWALSAVLFWLLTLGPTLRINGQNTRIPLPFPLIARLPFFEGNRYPSRYSVLLFLSLAMLVAFGLLALFKRAGNRLGAANTTKPRRGLAAALLLILAMLFEHLSAPLPMSDMRVPSVYRTVAGMAGDWTLLDLPVAWRNGFRVTGTLDTVIMFEQFYQTAHQKRILAGNTSRNPPLKFQYFAEAPVISSLIALETGHQVDATRVEQDRLLAADVLRFLDIRAVVVHPGKTGPGVVPYIEKTMPVTQFYDDGTIVAYQVELSPWPSTWTIEPGHALARLSFGEGWSLSGDGVAWAQRRAVRLLVPSDGQSQRLAFRAFAPQEGQWLAVEANGQEAIRLFLRPGTHDYEATLPDTTLHVGLNEILFRFEQLCPASATALSPRTVGQTGSQSPVNLAVQSAGQEVGDLAHIYVNGQDVSPNQRGYNVAVIHPTTGEVMEAASFDTHLDEAASRTMAAFLGRVPPGYIVAVAAADEASRLLGAEGVEALRGLGASGDLRDRFRWGHAIIGVQGAAPGSALEAMDWMRPVSLVVGEGATEPNLAAAFYSITFQALPKP